MSLLVECFSSILVAILMYVDEVLATFLDDRDSMPSFQMAEFELSILEAGRLSEFSIVV